MRLLDRPLWGKRELFVRTGPSFEYDRSGQVNEGDLLRVMGSIPDYSWMLVDFRGGVGWAASVQQ